MSTSTTSISNLALQLLGNARLVSFDNDDSVAARACRACYEALRDSELSAHNWNFAKKRKTLAPHGTEPAFDYDYAFPVPGDFLRPIMPARNGLDWSVENHKGVPAILTNDGDSIELVYVARITDVNLFHPEFVVALAARMAQHMCEEITQSNQKKEAADKAYAEAIRRAKRTNAFAQNSADLPEDPWVAARR